MGHQNKQLLSKMSNSNGHSENSSYFDGWKAYNLNPFHLTLNPKGVIQLGLAENLLCLDLIKEWIEKHPEASICTETGLEDFETVANFQDYHGLPSFRQGITEFMGKARGGKVEFEPDRIVMSGGATGAQETLAFCLADPGDAFIVPTPYYPGYDRDFCWRTRVKLIPLDCYSFNNFKITKTALESTYEKAVKDNIRVKGILMTNPSNPLGRTTDHETLKMLLKFTNQKKIHLICDEIFAGSVFGDQPEYTSVSELINEDPTYNKNLVHIAYSLSKDMGIPGFRVGIIYSYNDFVVTCARRMSSFGLISSQTQHLISHMLNDDNFTSKYLVENKRRLHKRHERLVSGLEKLGILCLESNAGLFVWMDLRRFLKENTVNAEIELWRTIINDVKLNVSPGSSFHCSEPGWFRVCFANMDNETMNVALERIRVFVTMVKKEETKMKEKKKTRFDELLRLSLPRERREVR